MSTSLIVPAIVSLAPQVDGKSAMTFANAAAIRRSLETAGVELIEEDGGPGARLKLPISVQSYSKLKLELVAGNMRTSAASASIACSNVAS